MCGNENGENEYDNPNKDTQKISKNWNIANDESKWLHQKYFDITIWLFNIAMENHHF